MGVHETLARYRVAALPLWLLVRVGARIVNALEAAQIPLNEIALLHYRIAGVPQPMYCRRASRGRSAARRDSGPERNTIESLVRRRRT